MARNFTQLVTLFQSDDVTTIDGVVISGLSGNITPAQATFSTDRTHARPWLMFNQEGIDKDANLIEGTVAIAMKRIRVQDVRQIANDQTTGWITSKLATAAGRSALKGCRIVEQQMDPFTGTFYTTIDGIIDEITLDDEYTAFTFSVRDIQERSRSLELFTRASTTVVYPRNKPELNGIDGLGVAGGWGLLNPADPTGNKLIPDSKGVRATFKRTTVDANAPVGRFEVPKSWIDAKTADSDWYTMYEVFNAKDYKAEWVNQHTTAQGSYMDGSRLTGMIIQWRAWGSTGAWTTLDNMPGWGVKSPGGFIFPDGNVGWFWTQTRSDQPLMGGPASFDIRLEYLYAAWFDASLLPANNADVELRVLSGLPPSSEVPLFLELNAAQFLQNCYDGVYSVGGLQLRYNSTTMTALKSKLPILRAVITQIEPDGRTWLGNNWYKPYRYIPRVNRNGEIDPFNWDIPDASVPLITLDDTNTVLKSWKWKDTTQDAVTKVAWTYYRDYISRDKKFATIEVKPDAIDAPGGALLGDRTVEYTPVTVHDLSTDPQGGYGTAIKAQELGFQLFMGSVNQLLDRFGLGGQHITGEALRSDPNVRSLQEGDWFIAGMSGLPDYGSGKRNLSRLMQVIRIQDRDVLTRTIEAVDAGPHGAPLIQPTVSSVTVDGSGRIKVVVTGVPAGADCRADFVVLPAAPATSDGRWSFLDRKTGNATLLSSQTPAGTAWVRVRCEQVGRRPSAYTSPVSVVVPEGVAVLRPTLVLSDGIPRLTWIPNTAVGGIRVYYAVTKPGQVAPIPLVTYIDIDGSTGSYDFPALREFYTLNVDVEAWSTFAAGAVGGTQGRRDPMGSVIRIDKDTVMPSVQETRSETTTIGTLQIDPTDPQLRVTRVAFQTQVGTSAPSAWVDTNQPGPYQVTVAKSTATTSAIRYRVYAYDGTGVEVIVQAAEVDFVGDPATAGTAECRARVTASDQTTVTVQGDVALPTGYVGTGTITLIAVSPPASLASGPGVGVASPTGTVWVLNRPGFQFGEGQIQLRANATGLQSDDDQVTIPEVGRDTVYLTVSASIFSSDANNVVVDVRVDDAVSQGSGAYINLYHSESNTGTVTPAGTVGSPISVVNGSVTRFTIPRGGFSAGTGRVVFKATAANRVSDTDSVDVPAVERDTQYCECRARITGASATAVQVQVDATSPGGTPQVRLISIASPASLNSGPGVGVASASGTVWVINRGAFQAGTGQGEFEAFLSGQQSDRDYVDIPEQGRDTFALFVQIAVVSITSTAVVVDVTATDPINQGGSYISMATSATGNVGSVTLTSGANPSGSGATWRYTIARPTANQGVGRVKFTATDGNGKRVSDTDAIDVSEFQPKASIAIKVEKRSGGTSTSDPVRIYAIDPIPQGFNTVSIYEMHNGTETNLGNTGTVTNDFATTGFIDRTYTRPSTGSAADHYSYRGIAAGRLDGPGDYLVETQDPSGSAVSPTWFTSYIAEVYDFTANTIRVTFSTGGATPTSVVLKYKRHDWTFWTSYTSGSGSPLYFDTDFDSINIDASDANLITYDFMLESYVSGVLNGVSGVVSLTVGYV